MLGKNLVIDRNENCSCNIGHSYTTCVEIAPGWRSDEGTTLEIEENEHANSLVIMEWHPRFDKARIMFKITSLEIKIV